jgi:hypothetical protein
MYTTIKEKVCNEGFVPKFINDLTLIRAAKALQVP